MKPYIAVVFWILVASTWGKPTEEEYTTKFDNLDIEEILRSQRLIRNYVNCLLDKGPCTSDGSELKKNVPDALQTDCSKCSHKQKESSQKIIKFLIDHKKQFDWWDAVEARYDPGRKYMQKYEVAFKEAKTE